MILASTGDIEQWADAPTHAGSYGPRNSGPTLRTSRQARVRCAHAGDRPTRTTVAAARDGGRGIRRLRCRGRRTRRRRARAGLEPVRRGRGDAHRLRAAVGEGCRDRPVRHRRQGRTAHRHRARAARARGRRRRARGSPPAARPRADRHLRRGGRDRRVDPRELVAALGRAVGDRGDRGRARAAVPHSAAARSGFARCGGDGCRGHECSASTSTRRRHDHEHDRRRPATTDGLQPAASTAGASSAGRAAPPRSVRSRRSAATPCRPGPAR